MVPIVFYHLDLIDAFKSNIGKSYYGYNLHKGVYLPYLKIELDRSMSSEYCPKWILE